MDSVYASAPFKFIVNGNPYYIHRDLVSHYSKPLDRMINGEMVEAQQGFAFLKDTDEGTMARFAEWAYKGYYTPANFKIEDSSPPSSCLSNEEEGETTSLEQPYPPIDPTETSAVDQQDQTENEVRTSEELKEAFLRREYVVRRDVIDIPPARANQEKSEDYTEVFLSHARLYVFAEKYDIQLLKTLAFERLHHTLATYTLYQNRTGDIMTLLRFVYDNTQNYAGTVDDLRKMMRDYVGFEMNVLIKDKQFSALIIEDGGPLLLDFMDKVAERIPRPSLHS